MHLNSERLFFALWPTPHVRERLSQAFNEIIELAGQGKIVNPSNLHITLHFLGKPPDHLVDCYIDCAQRIQLPSFELKINRPGYFSKPKISWLGTDVISPSLLQLQSLPGQSIQDCGFKPEVRHYLPHVTMARKIKQALTTDQVISIR